MRTSSGSARITACGDVIRFGDEVVGCAFADGRWTLETAVGFRDRFDVVIAATGVLHHPNVPEIPGSDSFGGAMFHSARWDHTVDLDALPCRRDRNRFHRGPAHDRTSARTVEHFSPLPANRAMGAAPGQ